MLRFKKMHGCGVKFSGKDVNMTKIIKALEDSDVLMEGITETFKSDIKKDGDLPLIPMLPGRLGAFLLTGRGLYRAGHNNNAIVVKDYLELVKGYLEQDKEFKKNH